MNNSKEAFEIVSGYIPVYAYEERKRIATHLLTICNARNISLNDGWNLIRKKYE